MKLFKKRKKKAKVIKKNTWRRNLKALDLRIDHRNRERTQIPDVDETMRVCPNCGESFTGRYCPQCGQAGTWSRYSWRQAFLNFLDIWGLGNRPMFRTIRELFTRPGYMARDYLNGHRQFYFPPFKLLAVTVVFSIFAYWVMGQEFTTKYSKLTNLSFSEADYSPALAYVLNTLVQLANFLQSNPLYETLVICLVLVCCIKISFRRIGGYNIVETFIFIIFVVSQFLLLGIFNMLFRSANASVGLLSWSTWLPALTVPIPMMASIVAVGLVAMCLPLFRLGLIVYDFKQFYGLGWKTTIVRLLIAFMYGIGIVMIVGCLISVAAEYGFKHFLLSLTVVLLMATGWLVVSQFIKKHRESINLTVYRSSRTAMRFALFFMPLAVLMLSVDYIKDGEEVEVANLNLLAAYAWSLAYVALVVLLGMLPAFLYRKYNRTWLSLVPLALFFLALVLFFYFYV